MKIKPIVIGMLAALVLPLAGANARAVLDPGFDQAGAGAAIETGAASGSENYGRKEGNGDSGKGSKGSKGDKGSKSPSTPH